MKARGRLDLGGALSLAFVLAACTIAYELLVAKTVAKLAGNAMLWESVTIGVFVLGMGLGAAASRKTPAAARWRTLALIELALTVAGAASATLVHHLHILYRIYIYDEGYLRELLSLPPVAHFAIAAQVVTLLIGFLGGAELPLLLAGARNARDEATLVGAHYLGTLAGTVVFTLGLSPHLSAVDGAVAVASVNAVAALALVPFAWPRRWPPLAGAAALAALALVGVASGSAELTQTHARNFYYNRFQWEGWPDGRTRTFLPAGYVGLERFLDRYPRIQRIVSAYQTIDVVPQARSPLDDGSGPAPEGFALYLDGRFQISTESAADYHEHLAHVPTKAVGAVPKRALVLGAGDGLLAHELLSYPPDQLEAVTLVELDPAMLTLARTYPPLVALNHGALDDPRIHVVNADAFVHLRESNALYDAAYVDLTLPFDFDSARLYSAEFLSLVRAHLGERGFVVFPSPSDFTEDADEAHEALFRSTLLAAGFSHVYAYKGRFDAFLLATLGGPARAGEHASGWRELAGPLDPDAVHSLLKPKLLGMEDPFF